MVQKNENEKPDIELAIRPQLLQRIFTAIDRYASPHKGIIVEFFRAGIVLKSQSSDFTSLLMVAVNKSEFQGYTVAKDSILTLDEEHAKKIIEFCKDKEDSNVLVLTYKSASQRITMKYGHVEKHFTHVWNSDIQANAKAIQDTCKKFFNTDLKLGEVSSEEFTRDIKNIHAMRKEHSNEYFRLQLEGTQLEFYQKLADDDEIIIEIEDVHKVKKTKESYKAFFQMAMFRKGLSAVAPLAETISFFGKSEHPIAISGQGSAPEDASKFEKSIDYWLILAPTVGVEED